MAIQGITDPKVRMTYLMLFAIVDGCPNGDPDADGAPRTYLDGNVVMTDVSQKFRLKGFAGVIHPEIPFYHKKGHVCHNGGYEAVVLQDHLKEAYNSLGYEVVKKKEKFVVKGVDADKQRNVCAEVSTVLCQWFYDLRMFGGVGADSKYNFNSIRGCFSIHPAVSVVPPEQCERTITRCIHAKADDKGNIKEGQMGTTRTVRYALMRASGTYIPTVGMKNGVTSEDLALFWESLVGWMRTHRSTMSGHIELQKLVVFVHGNLLGRCPDRLLWDRVRADYVGKGDYPTGIEDFDIEFVDADLPEGVTAYEFDGTTALNELSKR